VCIHPNIAKLRVSWFFVSAKREREREKREEKKKASLDLRFGSKFMEQLKELIADSIRQVKQEMNSESIRSMFSSKIYSKRARIYGSYPIWLFQV
jgi:hypothetical protein